MSNYLFALIDGGGAVPPALSVAGALVRNGHDVRVLGDPVAAGRGRGRRRASHRLDDRPSVATSEARMPTSSPTGRPARRSGAMARTRDGFLVGPAAEYARDTLDELAR